LEQHGITTAFRLSKDPGASFALAGSLDAAMAMAVNPANQEKRRRSGVRFDRKERIRGMVQLSRSSSAPSGQPTFPCPWLHDAMMNSGAAGIHDVLTLQLEGDQICGFSKF